MKRKIFSAIGAIWGAGIIINWLISNQSSGSDAYQAGQMSAVVVGAILLTVSVYSFFKKPKDPS